MLQMTRYTLPALDVMVVPLPAGQSEAEELTARAWIEDDSPPLAFKPDNGVISLLGAVGEVVGRA